jgi:hypothetical protein
MNKKISKLGILFSGNHLKQGPLSKSAKMMNAEKSYQRFLVEYKG